jgi:cyclohexyl-isocyanide hydratase
MTTLAFVIFPEVTQLDFTGPYEVLQRLPGGRCLTVAAAREPVAAQGGLRFVPDESFATAPRVDVLVVPGGFGVDAAMEDPATLEFVRRAASEARVVASVCTGALVLGAAGLLRGKLATTHWAYRELLPLFGATPVDERVVRDGALITGGGVTAGIDFGLTLLAELTDPTLAQSVQLAMEYDPKPPFDAGRRDRVDAEVGARVDARFTPRVAECRSVCERAAARL